MCRVHKDTGTFPVADLRHRSHLPHSMTIDVSGGRYVAGGSHSSMRFPSGSVIPSEATVLEVLDLPSYLDSFGAEGPEHASQILHAVVDHERRAVLAEVLRVSGEDRPDRVPSDLAFLAASPREEGHRVLDRDSQMTAVPLDQGLRVLRLEEDASDARHAGSTGSCHHAPEWSSMDMGEPSKRRPVRLGRYTSFRIRPHLSHY